MISEREGKIRGLGLVKRGMELPTFSLPKADLGSSVRKFRGGSMWKFLDGFVFATMEFFLDDGDPFINIMVDRRACRGSGFQPVFPHFIGLVEQFLQPFSAHLAKGLVVGKSVRVDLIIDFMFFLRHAASFRKMGTAFFTSQGSMNF